MQSTLASYAYPDLRRQIMEFMSGFSIEVTPRVAQKIASFRELLRLDTNVYVTYLPSSDFNDTIEVAKRLRREGFNPIPHIPARSLPSRTFFEEALKRLTGEAGVTQVLVIAGATDRPLGEFSDTMQLLATGLFDKYGIRTIGVAGHPEGSPDIPDEAIRQALAWKNDFAKRTGADLYIVPQFCFEAERIMEWDRHIQAEGNKLPIHVGIPGPATLKTLLASAKACGIGESMGFLLRRVKDISKLIAVSAPDELVTALSAYKASNPKSGIVGAHVFALGGLKGSGEWSYAVADGSFTLSPDSRRFSVQLPLRSVVLS